jgi:Flp pilus assembly protein TadG
MQSALRKLKTRLIGVSRSENGAALVEFAVIAVPFLGLIFGMLEVGLIFWAGYELDNATLEASRLIKTGQAQTNNYTQANMVTQICSKVAILSDCTSKLQLNVQSFSSFDCAAHPTQAGCTPASNYNLGRGSQIELITSSYEWPLFNFTTVALLSNLPDGNRLIQSAAVFQNEPF